MIEFRPSVIDEHGKYGYKAFGENAQGECICRLNGLRTDILSLSSHKGDRYVIEGLVRSCLNYAANRNAFTAYADESLLDSEAVSVLLSLGFKAENGILAADIPDVLKGSCCRCNK